MNTKTEIDFEKIINFIEPNGELLNTDQAINAMKEAVKQARDIILREAAEKAEAHPKYINLVDKSSILNLNDSQELNEKLGYEH